MKSLSWLYVPSDKLVYDQDQNVPPPTLNFYFHNLPEFNIGFRASPRVSTFFQCFKNVLHAVVLRLRRFLVSVIKYTIS